MELKYCLCHREIMLVRQTLFYISNAYLPLKMHTKTLKSIKKSPAAPRPKTSPRCGRYDDFQFPIPLVTND